MSVFDHKPSHFGGDCCRHCHDPWPCRIGKARLELAARSAEGRCPTCYAPSPDHHIQCPQFGKD